MPELPTETYLGDAVYVSFDGWQIRLRTGDSNNQVIFLEPGVWVQLQIWWEETVERIKQGESRDAKDQ